MSNGTNTTVVVHTLGGCCGPIAFAIVALFILVMVLGGCAPHDSAAVRCQRASPPWATAECPKGPRS